MTMHTMHNHAVFFCIWCAQPILLSGLTVILWRRKLHKQFPVFFLYLLAHVVIFAVLFPLWITGHRNLYFWPFCLSQVIDFVLGFKVIHEIFVDVFRPYRTLKDLGTLVFKWAGVVMVLVALVAAFSNSSYERPLMHAIANLMRSVLVAQVGLVLFLLLFSRFLGVSRKQLSFGISLGFGIFAAVDLMLLALHSGGLVTDDNYNMIDMVGCVLAIFVWFGYSLSRQVVRGPAVNHLQTERWEQSLADLRRPAPADSLLPRFESMVERASSRNSPGSPTLQSLALAVFGLVRHLLWQRKMTGDEAIFVCRASERTMLLGRDRDDFSLEIAAEAVETELSQRTPLPYNYSKSGIVN